MVKPRRAKWKEVALLAAAFMGLAPVVVSAKPTENDKSATVLENIDYASHRTGYKGKHILYNFLSNATFSQADKKGVNIRLMGYWDIDNDGEFGKAELEAWKKGIQIFMNPAFNDIANEEIGRFLEMATQYNSVSKELAKIQEDKQAIEAKRADLQKQVDSYVAPTDSQEYKDLQKQYTDALASNKELSTKEEQARNLAERLGQTVSDLERQLFTLGLGYQLPGLQSQGSQSNVENPSVKEIQNTGGSQTSATQPTVEILSLDYGTGNGFPLPTAPREETATSGTPEISILRPQEPRALVQSELPKKYAQTLSPQSPQKQPRRQSKLELSIDTIGGLGWLGLTLDGDGNSTLTNKLPAYGWVAGGRIGVMGYSDNGNGFGGTVKVVYGAPEKLLDLNQPQSTGINYIGKKTNEDSLGIGLGLEAQFGKGNIKWIIGADGSVWSYTQKGLSGFFDSNGNPIPSPSPNDPNPKSSTDAYHDFSGGAYTGIKAGWFRAIAGWDSRRGIDLEIGGSIPIVTKDIQN